MRISAAEWLDRILAGIGRLAEATVPIIEAHGRTLARDAHARYDLPHWDNSAMDGFALRSADLASASQERPVRLAVTGEVLAGSGEDPRIGPGCAVRIMTGAPVPSDADAVVPVELTAEYGDGGRRRDESAWGRDAVRFTAPVAPGANIRRTGEDTRAGTVIARRGDPLTAARVSAIAAAGVAEVRVSELPRVAVLVTGSELSRPGEELLRGRIVESNSLLMAGMLRECGLEPVEARRCGDDALGLRKTLDELSNTSDVIITTGGIGPGSHDIVRILTEEEPEVHAARVAIRPGQPQCAGRLASGSWLFALPGNPVSAAVSFELFVRPALLALQGRSEIRRRLVPAVAGAPWRGARDRLQVMPVVLDDTSPIGEASPLVCRPAVNPRGVSHAVGGHGAVQAYALVGEDRGDVAEGDTVDLVMVGLP